ncbi:MAG TPA: TolC family outer membrane protein [Gammaproteobacteria bacterium]|jgi:outer membrane protein
MKPEKLALLSIAVAVGLHARIADAQEGIIEIYDRALENDPALREAEANYLATAEARPQARASLLPSLQLTTSTSTQSSENPNPPLDFQSGLPSLVFSGTELERDSDNLSLSLNQTVFDWGRYVTLRQSDKIVARAETDFAAAQQDLILRVATTYFEVLAAEDNLASAVAARESIARQLEQAQRRFEVGLIAITDVQETQAGFDRAVADEIAAQRALASSQEFLREIIGEYVTELAGPTEDLPLLNPDPANPEQWVETALEQNLALVSSRISRDIAEDDIKIQRSVRFPTVDFSTGWQDQTSESTQTNNLFSGGSFTGNANLTESVGYNWQLNFRVPLYSGGVNRSRIQQTVYRHRSAMEALERVARQTERETRDAYLGVISEISRVQALRQAVQSAQTALRATEAGFEVGTRTSVDVLNVQNNLRQAETTYSRSRYDYILNVLRLQQAAGALDLEALREVDGWLE